VIRTPRTRQTSVANSILSPIGTTFVTAGQNVLAPYFEKEAVKTQCYIKEEDYLSAI